MRRLGNILIDWTDGGGGRSKSDGRTTYPEISGSNQAAAPQCQEK
jgi:hypothetical protein